MIRNPDRDYILRGSSPTFAIRPRSPTKSSKTVTTRSLSQNLLFSPDNLVHNFREDLARSSRAASARSATQQSLEMDDFCSVRDACVARPYTTMQVPRYEDRWFLEPDLQRFPDTRTKTVHYPTEQGLENGISNLHDVYRLTDRINRSRHPNAEKSTYLSPTNNHKGILARHYFPVTLGETNKVKAQLTSTAPPPKTPTFSPPASGLPARDEVPWRQETPHNRGTLGNRWSSTSKRLEKEFLLSDHAPSISDASVCSDGSTDESAASVFTSSPYQTELAQLRMARLKLEAEILKEVKRQEELERTRGPQPKWYELKTPQFNYESHKNTDLLRASDQWQDLYDYHQMLTDRSEEFTNRVVSPGQTYNKDRYML